MKVTDNYDRSILKEGRTYNMGFAFLKQVGDKEFETVQPISPCKDYLNEVVYAEQTGKLAERVYGFAYDGVNNIIGKTHTYMVIKMCKKLYNNYYNNNQFPKDKANLAKNYKNIQLFIRQLEAIIGIKWRTTITRANDDMFVVKIPNFWLQRVYLVSLYSLLLRAFQSYDNSIPAVDYIESGKCYSEDSSLVSQVKDKIKKILAGELPEQPFKNFKFETSQDKYKLHNEAGIVSFKF